MIRFRSLGLLAGSHLYRAQVFQVLDIVLELVRVDLHNHLERFTKASQAIEPPGLGIYNRIGFVALYRVERLENKRIAVFHLGLVAVQVDERIAVVVRHLGVVELMQLWRLEDRLEHRKHLVYAAKPFQVARHLKTERDIVGFLGQDTFPEEFRLRAGLARGGAVQGIPQGLLRIAHDKITDDTRKHAAVLEVAGLNHEHVGIGALEPAILHHRLRLELFQQYGIRDTFHRVPVDPHAQHGIQERVGPVVFLRRPESNREEHLALARQQGIRLLRIANAFRVLPAAKRHRRERTARMRARLLVVHELQVNILEMHLRAVDLVQHVLVQSQVVDKFRSAYTVVVVLLLEECEHILFRGARVCQQCKLDNLTVVIERRCNGIGNRTGLGKAFLHHQHLHHLRELFLLARGIVRTPEQVDQRGIPAEFHEQVHLARKQRLYIVCLREQHVVHAHEFLLVLHRLEEQAVVVQHLHVLVLRGIEREHKVLACGIGDTFLQVDMRHNLVLRDRLLAL